MVTEPARPFASLLATCMVAANTGACVPETEALERARRWWNSTPPVEKRALLVHACRLALLAIALAVDTEGDLWPEALEPQPQIAILRRRFDTCFLKPFLLTRGVSKRKWSAIRLELKILCGMLTTPVHLIRLVNIEELAGDFPDKMDGLLPIEDLQTISRNFQAVLLNLYREGYPTSTAFLGNHDFLAAATCTALMVHVPGDESHWQPTFRDYVLEAHAAFAGYWLLILQVETILDYGLDSRFNHLGRLVVEANLYKIAAANERIKSFAQLPAVGPLSFVVEVSGSVKRQIGQQAAAALSGEPSQSTLPSDVVGSLSYYPKPIKLIEPTTLTQQGDLDLVPHAQGSDFSPNALYRKLLKLSISAGLQLVDSDFLLTLYADLAKLFASVSGFFYVSNTPKPNKLERFQIAVINKGSGIATSFSGTRSNGQGPGDGKLAVRVYVCCSPDDEEEKKKLRLHLGWLVSDEKIEILEDDSVGEDQVVKIKQAICQAQIVILLLTVNFLYVNHILDKQMPALLESRQNEGSERLVVFPVIAKACVWDEIDWLKKMDIRPKHRKPIWRDKGIHVDEELVDITHEIAAISRRLQYA